jgi:dihydrofolate reductase
MKGGTAFHFVTDGIDAALKQASEAAEGKDVRLGGGVATYVVLSRKGKT